MCLCVRTPFSLPCMCVFVSQQKKKKKCEHNFVRDSLILYIKREIVNNISKKSIPYDIQDLIFFYTFR